MPEVSIERYTSGFSSEWNSFLAKSKNGTFLFDRRYMDYHSDRFKDHSLLIRQGGRLSAIFVANEKDGVIESHGGLTYGGLVLRNEIRFSEVIQVFKALVEYYHRLGFEKIIYKCLPSYLQSFTANEDQFALFAIDAKLIRRDTSSVIVNDQRLPYMHGRTQSINEARENRFQITSGKDCSVFWKEVLTPNLRERYDAEPVHTAKEMNLLMDSFPQDILLYEISSVAGAIVYVYNSCVHTQYLSVTQEGRQLGALDFLVDHLVKQFSSKKYFSLGTSNNGGGPDVNNGLLAWKEGFGARTFVHDFYQIETDNFKLFDRYE
jgi:hypothetical protein